MGGVGRRGVSSTTTASSSSSTSVRRAALPPVAEDDVLRKEVIVLGNLYLGRSGTASARGLRTNPELIGDAGGATDPPLLPLLTAETTCHSCHYRRALIIQCETALKFGGRHAFCATCLRRRLNVRVSFELREGCFDGSDNPSPLCHRLRPFL